MKMWRLIAMPEIKRPVRPLEVNYICDKCHHGMMVVDPAQAFEANNFNHSCVICGHQQTLASSYPRYEFVGVDE
jgi:uncharacterized CHY-type Zn-finger protein